MNIGVRYSNIYRGNKQLLEMTKKLAKEVLFFMLDFGLSKRERLIFHAKN